MLTGGKYSRRNHSLTVEDGRVVEIFAEFLSVHRCTRDEELQFRPEACDVLELRVRWYIIKGQQYDTYLD